jgi:hypothetical protein
MNPIAMARSQKREVSGPTLADYFKRERMSWEEVKELLKKQKEKTNSLAAFEDTDLHLVRPFSTTVSRNVSLSPYYDVRTKIIKEIPVLCEASCKVFAFHFGPSNPLTVYCHTVLLMYCTSVLR